MHTFCVWNLFQNVLQHIIILCYYITDKQTRYDNTMQVISDNSIYFLSTVAVYYYYSQ